MSILLIGLTGSAIGQASPNVGDAAEENIFKELDSLRHGLEEGLQNQNVDQLLSFLNPDVIVTWQNGEVSHGVEAVKKFLNKMLVGPDSVLTKIEVRPIVVEGRKITGDTIISYGKMDEVYYFREGGLQVTLTSRFSAWLKNDNGKVALYGLHLSANVFDNPVQSLMVKKAQWLFGVGGVVLGALLALIIGSSTCCRKKVK